MITHGAEHIVNSADECVIIIILVIMFHSHLLFVSLMINDDIDAIIQRGEARTNELNSKYEGLTFEDLSNFKSEASVQQWEGEDFRTGVCVLCLFLQGYTHSLYQHSKGSPCSSTRYHYRSESGS